MQVSAGFSYTWQGANPCGSKIVDVMLNCTQLVSNGTVLAPTQTFRVTINNFMATGGDNFAVFKSATDALGGAQDIDALIAYLAGFKAPLAPYDPASFPARITKLPVP